MSSRDAERPADPSVTAAAESGDRAALVELAASFLEGCSNFQDDLRTCETLFVALEAAGSVKLARELGESIAERWPDSPVAVATREEAAAAWIRSIRESGRLADLPDADLDAVLASYRNKAELVDRGDLALKFSKLHSEEDEPIAALAFAERAVELRGTEPDQLRLAACLRRCALSERAVELYEEIEASSIDGAHVAATGRAAALGDLQRLDEAADLIGAVVSGRPNDPYALNCAGGIAGKQGDLSGAADLFERALKAGGDRTPARSQLEGLAHQATAAGDLDLATRIRELLGSARLRGQQASGADENPARVSDM